jgi:hypothetical protein
MSLPLSNFFPDRRKPVVCPHCRKLGVVPRKIVFEGVLVLLGLMVLLYGLLDWMGLPRADTVPTILLYGAGLLGVIALATNLTCRFCRSRVTYFDRDLRVWPSKWWGFGR